MFDELRYRWRLRKYLKDYILTTKVHVQPLETPQHEGEPDIRRAQEKEESIQEQEIGIFRSRYLIEQAYLYHVPIPEDEGSWVYARYLADKYLTPEAAMKLRANIRAEQKANWEYWQGRLSLVIGLLGALIGVLAYLKK